jgi:hypothetical protein
MPRKNITEATPKVAPKSPPKVRPIRAPKVEPNKAPNPAPKARPRRTPRPAPIITSDQTLDPIRVYSLPRWEEPGPYQYSLSPHAYGNGGKMLGQWFTQADAEEGLRAGGFCEDTPDKRHFAFVKLIDNKVGTGKQWHEKIIPLDEDAGDDDLSLLDPDDIDLDDADLLNPAIVRAKIENAKLKAQLEARNGHGSSPMMERLFEQLLSEKLNRPDPLEEIAEREEKIERIRSVFNPRRESNPAQASQPQRSEEEIIASAVFKHPEVIETVIDSALKRFGGKEDGDSEPWYAEPIKDAVKTGQAAQMFNSAANVVQAFFGNVLSMFTPKPVQPPAHQAPAPQASTVQPPQSQQTAPAIEPAQQPAQLPANDQQQPAQAAQPQVEQGAMQMAPVDALVYSLIQLMEKQAPITDAQNVVNIAVVRNPELGESIDELLALSVDQVLAMLAAYHPPVAQMTHAKTWLESLMNALAGEGDEFAEKEIETQ